MPPFRKQHWVSQSYLRRFSRDEKHVYLFDKRTDRVARPHVRDVAQGKFFNDGFLRNEKGELLAGIPQGLLEREFGKWEEALARVTRVALTVAEGGRGSAEDRQTMAICVAVQLMRTPAVREQLAREVTADLEDEANTFLAEQMPDAAAKYRVSLSYPDSWRSALHFHFIWRSGELARLASDLNQYIWRIGLNPTPMPLCTSDRPVIAYLHDAVGGTPVPRSERANDVMRKAFVGDRPLHGIEVIYPLTSEVLLLMYHPGHFGDMQHLDGGRKALSPSEVLHYNALQLLECERQVFSPDDVFDQVRQHAAGFREVFVA